MAIKRLRRNVGYGLTNPLQELPPLVIESTRAPTTSDAAQIGTTWVNKTTASVYVLAKASAGSYTWSTSPGSGVGSFTSLAVSTGDLTFAGGATGNIVMPVGDLTITAGNATIGGDLTVVGTVAFTGDIDITTASAYDIIATGNQDPAISFTTNGGATETIQITNTQGTAADAIDISATVGDVLIEAAASTDAASIALSSVAGGIDISAALLVDIASSRNNAQAILINASAGGIDVTATGTAGEDIDITASGSSINLTAGEDAADSIVISSTNGGIDITAAGAAAGEDIDISSTGSSINISASEAVSDAIVIDASNAAGGIEIKAGTNGIDIGNEADTAIVNIGGTAPTASRLISIGGGTVAVAAVTDTIDIGPDGATANANSIKVVKIGAGIVATGENNINIGSGNVSSGTHVVNVSTGTGTKTVNAGNADALTTMNLDATLNINTNVNASIVALGGTSTGGLAIGSANAGAMTWDTGAGISIDSVTASNFTVTGTADLTLSSTAGAVNITSNQNGVVDSIKLDATAANGGITMNAGTNGIIINPTDGDVTLQTTSSGRIHLLSLENIVIWNHDEQSSASAAVTSDTHNGQGVFTGFTTASAAAQVFTITNTHIETDTALFVSACNAGANDAQMTVTRIKKLSGSMEVTLTNNGAAALNGDVNISWLIYKT